jgi:hypothetical protein
VRPAGACALREQLVLVWLAPELASVAGTVHVRTAAGQQLAILVKTELGRRCMDVHKCVSGQCLSAAGVQLEYVCCLSPCCRGRGRGGDSNGYVATGEGQGGEYHEGEDFGERGRGRGRGRGRRGRGRGRGRGGPPSGEVEGYAAGGYHDADDGHEGGYDAGEGAPRRPRRNRGPRRGRGRGRGGEGDEGHAHAE